MLCEICHKNEAVIFLDQTQNNEHRHLRICMDCAKKNGIVTENFKISLFPQNFLKQFHSPKKVYPASSPKKAKKFDLVQCPHCHTTLNEFKKNHTVGCAHCWNIFAFSLIGKDYEEIHYDGKQLTTTKSTRPIQSNNIESIQENIKILQIKLKNLIQKERYEEAIKIRDKIKIIKKQADLCN